MNNQLIALNLSFDDLALKLSSLGEMPYMSENELSIIRQKDVDRISKINEEKDRIEKAVEVEKQRLIDFKSSIKYQKFKGEFLFRKFLEEALGKKFPKTRKAGIYNPKTGHPLELDMYNEELKLAFEYDGNQHHTFIKRFHRSKKKFKEMLERDREKDEQCKLLGINLIRIKQAKNPMKIDMCKFTIDRLLENNIQLSPAPFK